MDIIYEYKKRCHNDIITAAYVLDEDAAMDIETSYKDLWDSGETFVGIAFPGTRCEDDGEDQINGFCRAFDNALRDLILDRWVRKYSRDQMVTLLNLLYMAPSHQYTRITLAGDYSVDLDDIRLKWNHIHPKEPLRASGSLEI